MSEPNPQEPHDPNFGSFVPVENPWRIKHPVVTFFHLLFRTLALIGMTTNSLYLTIISLFAVYLLSGWSSSSYIESFIAIILLLSLDFWTVKNITGMASISLHSIASNIEHLRKDHGWSQMVELCQ